MGLVHTGPVPGSPQSPRVFAGIALRSQAGFEEGYSLLVVKPLRDDDDLYSVEPRFSFVRNIDRLSTMATLISAPTLYATRVWSDSQHFHKIEKQTSAS